MEYKLRRTGDAPLVFTGEAVADVSTRRFHGREQNRWWELSLYRTDGGNYVLRIEYCTQWEGEPGYSAAEQCTPGDVTDLLREFDPIAHVQGFPAHEAYAEKQRNLLTHMRRQWDNAVSDLLEECDDLAERIE